MNREIARENLEAVKGWARKSLAAPRINAMVDMARSEPGVPILPKDLDRDPWLLNCPNGALELQTGTLREHRREDLITKLCPVEYDPAAKAPTWECFLESIFQGDAELVLFVQRLLGMCLTGEVREHVLPVFWGQGANGKSTLVNAVLEMLGPDYAIKAAPEILMARHGERHPTELADLFGRRLVVCSETPQGRRLNEALVKDLTGGEPIRARRMKEDVWEFVPTHKVILCTNHKPAVLGTDEGIWRRLRLLPFEVTFWDPDDPNKHRMNLPAALRQDKDLPGKLCMELSGILAWCVRGCLDWQRDGLTLPEKVRVATKDYRDTEDLLAQFLCESCLVGPDYRVKASDLYTRHRTWCEAAGERPPSQIRFGESLIAKGFERYTNNGTWYRGLALRQPDGDAFEGELAEGRNH
jgi:putative DNA primase/helicase